MKQTFYGLNNAIDFSPAGAPYCHFFPTGSRGYQGQGDTSQFASSCSPVMPISCTITDVKASLTSSLGSDYQLNFGTTTLTIPAGQTSATLTNIFNLNAADRFKISSLTDYLSNDIFWSYKLDTNTSDAVMLGWGATESNTTGYAFPFSNNRVNNVRIATTESERSIICPMDITIKKFYIGSTANIGGGNITLSIMKNGSEEASSQVTLNSGSMNANVTGLNIAVAAGDALSIKIVQASSILAARAIGWGISYTPSVTGASIVGGFCETSATNTQNSDEFLGIQQSANAWDATESNVAAWGRVQHNLNKLSVKLTTAPGASKTRDFYVRVNGADTSLGGSISGTDTLLGPVDSPVTVGAEVKTAIRHRATTSGNTSSGKIAWSAIMYGISSGTDNSLFFSMY